MIPTLIRRKTRNRWFLNTNELYRGAEHVVEWDSLMPQGAGSRHQREYLQRSCKGFLIAMILAPRITRGMNVASGTVLNWFFHLKRLVHWMIAHDVWRFSQLTEAHVVEYLSEDNAPAPGEKNTGNSSQRAYKRLLQQLWDLRCEYIAPLRFDPATLYLSVTDRRSNANPWKPIDESIALPLIKDAIECIELHGEYVLSLFDRIWAVSNACVGVSKKGIASQKAMLCEEFENEAGFSLIRNSFGLRSESSVRVVEQASRIIEGACIVVILFLVGMRVRELVSLNSGCLIESKHMDGVATYHLDGVAAKSDGRRRTWAVTEPVRDAIQFLEHAHRNSRGKWSAQALIMQPQNGRNFPEPRRRACRIIPAVVSKRLAAFAKGSFREPIPFGVRVHPHAARKTFARFVVLRDKRALESLSYHFGHVHRAITDGAYIGADIELEKLLSEENRKDLARGLEDMLRASHIGGKAGKTLKGLRDNYVSGPEFRGKKGLVRLVEKLIDEGVQLAPCDWGYCVYSKAMSACRGDERGPNELRRSPDVCSSCSNFAVTERHRAWWEARYTREEAFLQRADKLPAQTRILVQKRLSETGRILAAINDISRSNKIISMDVQSDDE